MFHLNVFGLESEAGLVTQLNLIVKDRLQLTVVFDVQAAVWRGNIEVQQLKYIMK